jgi:hypothetical protein
MPATLSGVLVAWAVAAAMVGVVGSVTLKTLIILAVACGYMRGLVRHATLDHALFVGVTWLLLTIAAELLITKHFGRTWFALLGSPDSALRNILMFAWIGAPALFARHGA